MRDEMDTLKRRTTSTTTLLLLLIVSFQGSTMVMGHRLNYTHYKHVGSLRFERIQRHLDKINKPAIATIQSPDGDIIDCVHRHKQPALDHPLLKNHKIQRVAPERPRRVKEMVKTIYNESEQGGLRSSGSIAWQTWHEISRDGCPKGTVPVRRSSVHDVRRAKSLYHFGKKPMPMRLSYPDRRVDAPDVVSGNGHEGSEGLSQYGQQYVGQENAHTLLVSGVQSVSLYQPSPVPYTSNYQVLHSHHFQYIEQATTERNGACS